MNRPDTPREARKKLLLLEAQLHRLDLTEARQGLRAAMRGGLPAVSLPAALGAGLTTRGTRLLLAALPWLLRGGTLGRWMRRALLLAGGGAAALALLQRWLSRDTVAAPGHAADEKNPGRNRD